MALIICSECGKQVSERAVSCPNCGNPITISEKEEPTKFCKHCGGKIPEKAVICTLCGCQVEEVKNDISQPNIVVNNTNTNVNQNMAVSTGVYGRAKDKWIAFFLCLILGVLGAHKFYEGKIGMGILYIFTGGLFAVGWIIDIVVLLSKPNPYYV